MSENPLPVEIKQSGARELRIVWNDGQVNDFDVVELRRSCRCANCVDELTGAQILHSSQVGEDVRPQTIRQVGNYAFQVNWSDGHTSGIFTFDYLRQLAETFDAPSGPSADETGPAADTEEDGQAGGGCSASDCGCGG